MLCLRTGSHTALHGKGHCVVQLTPRWDTNSITGKGHCVVQLTPGWDECGAAQGGRALAVVAGRKQVHRPLHSCVSCACEMTGYR